MFQRTAIRLKLAEGLRQEMHIGTEDVLIKANNKTYQGLILKKWYFYGEFSRVINYPKETFLRLPAPI
jgi:hypothetical protein